MARPSGAQNQRSVQSLIAELARIQQKIQQLKNQRGGDQRARARKIAELNTKQRQIIEQILQRGGIQPGQFRQILNDLKSLSTLTPLFSDQILRSLERIPGIGPMIATAGAPISSIAQDIRVTTRQELGLPEMLGLLRDPRTIRRFSDTLDQTVVALRRNTIGAGDLTRTLGILAKKTMDIGISNRDSANAMDALYRANLAFTEYNDLKARRSLIEYTAILQRFGVSAGLTGDITNTLSKQFGFGADKAKLFLQELAGVSKSLGISLPRVMQEFNANSERLLLTGVDRISNRFKNLQGIAKATGISIGDVVRSLGQGTDTFASSATMAARLNAQFGLNISSMELLRNKAEDNIILIQKRLRESGKTFSQLSMRERQFLSSTLNLRVSQLKKLMEMSPVELALKQAQAGAGGSAGLRQELASGRAATRVELTGGVGERLMFQTLNKLNNTFKTQFSRFVAATRRDPAKIGLETYKLSLRTANITLQGAFQEQAKYFRTLFPRQIGQSMSRAMGTVESLLRRFLETFGGDVLGDISVREGRSNRNLGGQVTTR